MKKNVSVFLLVAVAGIAFAVPPAATQEQQAEVTQKDAETAARSVARYCKILITRMDGIIEDKWATQDLQDLAVVWDSLNCHEVFGVDERIRWLVR